MRELLFTLLPLCTTECEIRKNFAKLKFRNGNAYTGWLGPNGFQGLGKYKYANGASFHGSFDKSLLSKSGKLEYENRDVYEGEFLATERHGYGLYRGQGFKYSGNFKNGSFHGDGVWKSKNRELRGRFENGTLTKGEVDEFAGAYKGTFEKSGLRKYGRYTFKNGNTYTGHWRDDMFFGYGVYNWVDDATPHLLSETKYTGYWMNGKPHALGMLRVSRRIIMSQWMDGKRNGAGVIFSVNGNCYAGIRLFDDNNYRQGFKIRNCPHSRVILKDIMSLVDSDTTCSIQEKSAALTKLIGELVKNYSEKLSPVNPVYIPDYELGDVAPDFCDSDFEIDCLQRVLSENYSEFRKLYLDYRRPGDEYLSPLSLNLLYMDIFQSIRDVNIIECMTDSFSTISNLIMSVEGVTELTMTCPIPFYNFFQHIVCITKVLMRNEQLSQAAETLKPTKFGVLAMQVLLLLRMLKNWPKPIFCVRKALFEARTSVVSLMERIESVSHGDKSVRVAYKFLKSIGAVDGCSLNFKRVVEFYFDNVFEDDHPRRIDFQMSNLELMEIILCTCQLHLKTSRVVGVCLGKGDAK